jgi:hypothetical protein
MEQHDANDKSDRNAGGQQPESKPEHLSIAKKYASLRDFPIPGKILTLFSVYVLLVYTIATIGTLALSAGHKITSEICFYLSIAMVMVIPIALTLYFRSPFGEGIIARTAKRFSDMFDRFMSRHLGLVAIIGLVFCVGDISLAIYAFPTHPQRSLAWIVVDVFFALLFVGATACIRGMELFMFLSKHVIYLLEVDDSRIKPDADAASTSDKP